MNEIKEEWKRIKGLPKYEVSTLGNVKRVNGNKYLQKFNSFGRNYVLIKKGKAAFHHYVDNLVAYTFLPLPYTITEPKVYHKNKNYLDDRLKNLHFRKNVQTNTVLVNIYLFKNNKCYLVTTLSFYRAMKYLNCSQSNLNYAIVHTSIIVNDDKEYKVEYNFNTK